MSVKEKQKKKNQKNKYNQIEKSMEVKTEE
jgi:hypothetical protein